MKNNPKELIEDLKVIRTIHSNKARKYGELNFFYLITTIIVAVIVTFIGFWGPENIVRLVNSTSNDPTNSVDTNGNVKLIMDLMTLSILVITILGLILRYENKANKHNNAIVRLTEFISMVEFSYTNETTFKQEDIALYAEKYRATINSLPPTTDNDYFYALKTIKKKKIIKKFIEDENYDKMNVFQRKWALLWI